MLLHMCSSPSSILLFSIWNATEIFAPVFSHLDAALREMLTKRERIFWHAHLNLRARRTVVARNPCTQSQFSRRIREAAPAVRQRVTAYSEGERRNPPNRRR